MATILVLAVALAAASPQREPIAPTTAAHVQRILDGGVDEGCAAARSLAALGEEEAVEAVRALLAAPKRAHRSLGWGGRLGTSCTQDGAIGLPAAADYLATRFWLEDGPIGAGRARGIEHVGGAEPCIVGCVIIQGWGEGAALVAELRALLRRADRSNASAEVVRALGARGHPSAIPDLAALLNDGSAAACATVALARFGPAADAAVIAVLRAGGDVAEESALWYVARHAARMPGDVLADVAARLAGEHHREALTALVQAGMRAEGLLLRELQRGGVAAERAVAGLTLLPGRTGPAFPALLAIVRETSAPPRTRALALRYVAESPAGVGLLTELARLAETAGNLMVRTAAARALGRVPITGTAARDMALLIVASDAPDNVRIAALRSAVDCDPSAAMRGRLELLSRGREARWAVRSEAGALISFTEWRD